MVSEGPAAGGGAVEKKNNQKYVKVRHFYPLVGGGGLFTKTRISIGWRPLRRPLPEPRMIVKIRMIYLGLRPHHPIYFFYNTDHHGRIWGVHVFFRANISQISSWCRLWCGCPLFHYHPSRPTTMERFFWTMTHHSQNSIVCEKYSIILYHPSAASN